MSNPDFPSCLLPSAKYGWGHAECSLLCRPDGSCKIKQFCLLKHQLFSKISIRSHMAMRSRSGERRLLRDMVPALPRGHLPAQKLWKTFAAVPMHPLNCRKANPACPYGLLVLGTSAKGFSSPWAHGPTHLAAPLKNYEIKDISSLVRYGTRSGEVSLWELKLCLLQDVTLANQSCI